MRPLDLESLATLQSQDSSYNQLTMSGGWFAGCMGEYAWQVYGQVNHHRNATDMSLIAGVQYINNAYVPLFDTSFLFLDENGYIATGYIFDTQ